MPITISPVLAADRTIAGFQSVDVAARPASPIDPTPRGRQGAQLLRAPYTPGLELAPPRLTQVADIRYRRSWQVGLPTLEDTRAFFQTLLAHRAAIDIGDIRLSTFRENGREPSRMLTFPLAMPMNEQQEALRGRLMDAMHDDFGVPRYDYVRASGIDLPITPCIIDPVDVDAVRAMLRSGVLDEQLVQTVFQRRGAMPPYIDPDRPYDDGGDVQPDPEKTPACQMT